GEYISWIDGWGYCDSFFKALLDESGWDALYRYVLGEFESAQDGAWIHGDRAFQFEHIFPQNPPVTDESTLRGYGFRDLEDYQRFIGRLGNRLLIPTSLNAAIGHAWPDIKVQAYTDQAYGQTSVPA